MDALQKLKHGDVVTHMNKLSELAVEIIVGGRLSELDRSPLIPFSPESLKFLSAWSSKLFSHKLIRDYPDVAGFAYWCRRANLSKLLSDSNLLDYRIGRGLAFHIAPGNVPVNFAFSFAFGLLSGNANIVRLPELKTAQADLLCETASEILATSDHSKISSMTRFVRYSRNDLISQVFSSIADVRLIWGGDSTVNHFRFMRVMPRCVDICFSDRYSICLISAKAILSANETTLIKLAEDFYNDVFLLDQNACSSPHLVLWQGNDNEVTSAQSLFWGFMSDLLNKKPSPPPIHSIDKFTHLCRTAIRLRGNVQQKSKVNRIYRLDLSELPKDISDYKGGHGFFFESIDNDLLQLKNIVNNKYQTLTTFGVDNIEVAKHIIREGMSGIDRVVPIGKALDIGVIWDGYDIIRSLSRIIALK